MLEPIQRQLVYRTVLQRLKHHIDTKLKPGDRLPAERELAVQLNVDRSSVRTAIHILEALRLVDIRPGQGVFVLDPAREGRLDVLAYWKELGGHLETDELRSALDARILVEQASLHKAMSVHRESLANHLSEVLVEEKQALEAGLNTTPMDEKFHHIIVQSSKNIIYLSIKNTLDVLYRESRQAIFNLSAVRLLTHQRHSELVEAIRAGDEGLATEALHKNLWEEGNAFLELERRNSAPANGSLGQ